MSWNSGNGQLSQAREYELVGEPSARALFITRTYLHLLGAVAAFVAIEWLLFSSGVAWRSSSPCSPSPSPGFRAWCRARPR